MCFFILSFDGGIFLFLSLSEKIVKWNGNISDICYGYISSTPPNAMQTLAFFGGERFSSTTQKEKENKLNFGNYCTNFQSILTRCLVINSSNKPEMDWIHHREEKLFNAEFRRIRKDILARLNTVCRM